MVRQRRLERRRVAQLSALAALLSLSGCISSRHIPASSGIVLERESQAPVADAAVLASYTTGGLVLLGVADGCKTYHVTKTDGDGRFRIPATTGWNVFIPPLFAVGVGRPEIAVYKSGYQPSRATSSAEKDDVLVLLTPAYGTEPPGQPFGLCPQLNAIPRDR